MRVRQRFPGVLATVRALSVGPDNPRQCTAGDARGQAAGTGCKGPAEMLRD